MEERKNIAAKAGCNVVLLEAVDWSLVEEPYQHIHIVEEFSLAEDFLAMVSRARNVQALVVRNKTQLGRCFFEQVSGSVLKVVGRLGAGLDNIDVAAAKEAGVAVVYAPDAGTHSVAEYCVNATLSALRHVRAIDLSTKAGDWDRYSFIGREISELSIGILGYGRIGRRYAEIMSAMNPQKILVYNRSELQGLSENMFQVSLPDVFQHSHVISVHMALSSETEGMVDNSLLQYAQKDLVLINAARGGVVNEDDLYMFLKENPQAQAVFDVRAQEPPSVDDEIRSLPNVMLTPHIAAFTKGAQRRVVETVFADIDRILRGEEALYSAY